MIGRPKTRVTLIAIGRGIPDRGPQPVNRSGKRITRSRSAGVPAWDYAWTASRKAVRAPSEVRIGASGRHCTRPEESIVGAALCAACSQCTG